MLPLFLLKSKRKRFVQFVQDFLMTALGIFIVLFFVGVVFGEVKIVGDSRSDPHKLVTLRTSGADGAALIWDVSNEEAVSSREIADGTLDIVAKPGTYKVKVRAVWVKDGKISVETARHVLTFGDAPTPPDPKPPTPPDPKPPTPPDPKPPTPPGPQSELGKKLQVAYASDPAPAGAKRGFLLSLAGFYEGVADSDYLKGDVGTVGDMLGYLRVQRETFCPDSALVPIRKVLSEFMLSSFGDDASAKVDAVVRDKAKVTFLTISKALQEVK